MNKHALADHVRILARGKNASRNMTLEEAEFTMSEMLKGNYEPEQLGAVFMLLRVLEESPAEIAGFAKAINAYWPDAASGYDLVWGSYAGKRRQPMWWVLSAKLLTAMGYRILIHGTLAHTEGRIYAYETCSALGIPSLTRKDLDSQESESSIPPLAYLPCSEIHPTLQKWLGLKAILGVRSPINTVLKAIAPEGTPSVQGIFHPTYRALHAQAAEHNGETAVIIKGEGGEFEVNPERKCVASYHLNAELGSFEIPNIQSHYQDKPSGIDPTILEDFWSGKLNSEYGQKAVIHTAALALCAIKQSTDLDSAIRECEQALQKVLGKAA